MGINNVNTSSRFGCYDIEKMVAGNGTHISVIGVRKYCTLVVRVNCVAVEIIFVTVFI